MRVDPVGSLAISSMSAMIASLGLTPGRGEGVGGAVRPRMKISYERIPASLENKNETTAVSLARADLKNQYRPCVRPR